MLLVSITITIVECRIALDALSEAHLLLKNSNITGLYPVDTDWRIASCNAQHDRQ